MSKDTAHDPDDAPDDVPELPAYAERVLDVAERIPPGRVMTYGDVAEWLGEGGPRQVGHVMALYGGAVPWWRVVRADGGLLPGHELRALEHYRAEGTPCARPRGRRRATYPVSTCAGPAGTARTPCPAPAGTTDDRTLTPSSFRHPGPVDAIGRPDGVRQSAPGRSRIRTGRTGRAVPPVTGGVPSAPGLPGHRRHRPPHKHPHAHGTGEPRDLLLHTPDGRRRTALRGDGRAFRRLPAATDRSGTGDAPELDAAQRAVVEHPGGPLLVLAGPGTGKTTTLVEAVAEHVRRGTDPERILVLTFSRKAAGELRDRMAARMGGAAAPQATTFHSFCYALVRAHQDPELFADPLRLMSGPEQDLAVRELLAGEAELERRGRTGVRWPDELRAALTTRGFADEVRAVLARTRELGLGPRALAAFAGRTGRPDWSAAAGFLAEYLDVLDLQGVIDYAELVHRAVLLAGRPEVARHLAGAYEAVYVDEYQDTDPAQVRLLQALAGGGRHLVAFGDPDQSIYAFRGADVNGILGFPDAFRHADGRPAGVRVLTTSRRSGAGLLAATRLLTRRMPLTRLPAAAVRAHRELTPVRDGARSPSAPTPRPAPNSTASPTSCAAPTWRTASPGPTWPSWSAPAPARCPYCGGP